MGSANIGSNLTLAVAGGEKIGKQMETNHLVLRGFCALGLAHGRRRHIEFPFKLNGHVGAGAVELGRQDCIGMTQAP